jgi:hypothetical protein
MYQRQDVNQRKRCRKRHAFVQVQTVGGDMLNVHFVAGGREGEAIDVRVTGSCTEVFSGTINIAAAGQI